MGCLLRGFVKIRKNTKPHRCRSWQVFTGCFVITKTKRKKYYRASERVLGTLTGIAVAGLLLSHPMQGWQIVVWIVILQYLTEMYVTRNYTIAASFITPTHRPTRFDCSSKRSVSP